MASLIPTLELSAGDYSTHDRPLPQGSSAKNPRGWRDYWTESLADSGILGLPLLDVGYSLVALSALTDPGILRTILRRSLETIGVADLGKLEDLDELCSLCGGYVLQHQSYQMVPGCCGDLANLEEWSSAAAHPGEAWEMLWIGHPWTHVRASGDLLHLAEPSELSAGDALVEALCLPRRELLDAIEAADRERDAFGERLLPLIEELHPRVPAGQVLDVLLRGHPQPPPDDA
jgi:hypothetical protein